MASKKIAQYGTWTSPITTDIVSGSSLVFAEVHANTSNGSIYLIEGRPSEKGRQVVVQLKGTESIDILPKEYSARSRVHEYGGGAAAITPGGNFIFADHSTNGVFELFVTGELEPPKEILEKNPKLRYADFDVHPTETATTIAVQEDHTPERLLDAINTLVIIDAVTKKAKIIVQGADFYSHPKFSPDGRKISWMQWNHPDMPWTGSELFFAEWNNGNVGKATKVAGKAEVESITQPKWHLDNTLLFTSDRTGFAQLFRYDVTTGTTEHLPVAGFQDADLAGNEFQLGSLTYVSLDKDALVIMYCRNATEGLLLHNIATKTTTELLTGLVSIDKVTKVSSTEVAVIGGTLTSLPAVYLIDVTKPTEKKLLKTSVDVDLPSSIFSPAQTITFPRTHGKELGTPSHAIFIPPQNPDFSAPPGTKPPLIIFIHGGPTSQVSPGLALNAQYFTSRGYAYCYPNYAGSTGYGRKYREQLDGYWGIKDVEDTVSCIDYLASQNLIDGTKVGISGRSSGGYTTIQGLCTYPTSFTAGVSLFGIGNLKALGEDSHKFESHYLDNLILPAGTSKEDQEKIFHDRSPCYHADLIERPLLLLQGDIDMVVPLQQATEMERVLKAKGADVKLVVFEGEGHGFKMRENLKRAIEEEEAMWRRTLLS